MPLISSMLFKYCKALCIIVEYRLLNHYLLILSLIRLLNPNDSNLNNRFSIRAPRQVYTFRVKGIQVSVDRYIGFKRKVYRFRQRGREGSNGSDMLRVTSKLNLNRIPLQNQPDQGKRRKNGCLESIPLKYNILRTS